MIKPSIYDYRTSIRKNRKKTIITTTTTIMYAAIVLVILIGTRDLNEVGKSCRNDKTHIMIGKTLVLCNIYQGRRVITSKRENTPFRMYRSQN